MPIVNLFTTAVHQGLIYTTWAVPWVFLQEIFPFRVPEQWQQEVPPLSCEQALGGGGQVSSAAGHFHRAGPGGHGVPGVG